LADHELEATYEEEEETAPVLFEIEGEDLVEAEKKVAVVLCETDDKEDFLFPKQGNLNIPEPILANFFEDFLTLIHQLGALLLTGVVIHALCFNLQEVIKSRASHAGGVPHFRGCLHLQFGL
jgi:hypothetical protein